MSSLHVRLGAVIRDRRLELGLSQEAVADAAGLHRHYPGLLERGERNVGLDTLARILEVLDVTFVEVFTAVERIPAPDAAVSDRATGGQGTSVRPTARRAASPGAGPVAGRNPGAGRKQRGSSRRAGPPER